MRRAPDLIAALAVLMVAVLLVLRVTAIDGGGNPPPPPAPECEGPACGELVQVVKDLEDGTLDAQAEEVAEQRGLVAAGDTCFMRHAGLTPAVPRDWRERFALTTLVSTADDKRELLLPMIETAPDPLSRWRVLQALADTEFRAGNTAGAEEWIVEALSVSDLPDQCRADSLRLGAMTRSGLARLEMAFAAAQADPASYLAQLDLALAAADLDDAGQGSCESRAVATIRAVVQLDALIENDRQLAVVERLLGPAPSGLPALFLAGMIQERGARSLAAIESYETALAQAAVDPCGAVYAPVIEVRLSTLAARAGEGRG